MHRARIDLQRPRVSLELAPDGAGGARGDSALEHPAAQGRDAVAVLLDLGDERAHGRERVGSGGPPGSVADLGDSCAKARRRLRNPKFDPPWSTGEGVGKAGGYAVQGRAEIFVRRIGGSYSNVVGLPLRETISLLRAAGYPC